MAAQDLGEHQTTWGNHSTTLQPIAKQLPMVGVVLSVGHPIPVLAGD